MDGPDDPTSSAQFCALRGAWSVQQHAPLRLCPELPCAGSGCGVTAHATRIMPGSSAPPPPPARWNSMWTSMTHELGEELHRRTRTKSVSTGTNWGAPVRGRLASRVHQARKSSHARCRTRPLACRLPGMLVRGSVTRGTRAEGLVAQSSAPTRLSLSPSVLACKRTKRHTTFFSLR